MQLRRSLAFVASVLLPLLLVTPCFAAADSTPAPAKGKGRVTIVYQDDAIQPENRDAIKKIRDSGVFERIMTRKGAIYVRLGTVTLLLTRYSEGCGRIRSMPYRILTALPAGGSIMSTIWCW